MDSHDIKKQVENIAVRKNIGDGTSVKYMHQHTPVKKFDSTLITAIFVGALAVFGFLYVMKDKTNSYPQPNFNLPPVQQPYVNNVPPPVNNVNPYNPYQFQSLEPFIDQKIENHPAIQSLQKRTWMLALANNENAGWSRSLANSVNRGDIAARFILFDHKWQFNKLPELQEISNDDMQKLIQNVKLDTKRVSEITEPTQHIYTERYVYPNQRIYSGCSTCR